MLTRRKKIIPYNMTVTYHDKLRFNFKILKLCQFVAILANPLKILLKSFTCLHRTQMAHPVYRVALHFPVNETLLFASPRNFNY